MSMNVSAMSGTASGIMIDSEYQRIIRELRALGIEPTGNKTTDKAKLEEAKAAKAKKTNQVDNIQFVNKTEDTEKADEESSKDAAKDDKTVQAEQMTGATQLAQLNKYKLLGLY